MRLLPFFCLAFLTACSSEANHIGNPLLLPLRGLQSSIENAAYDQRRGQVEVAVKSSWPTILEELELGQGPVLSEAMTKARIPIEEQPARILQLQGDIETYTYNPGALVVALMVYGR